MKTVLSFALVLCSLATFGQVQLPDIQIYRGNPYTVSLIVSAADSAKETTAVLYASQLTRNSLAPSNQPTVLRAGRQAFISWSNTRDLPDVRAWLEISAGPLIKWTGWVITNKRTPVILDPAENISGPVPLPGSTSHIYKLASVLGSGYTIQHNKSNKLVTGTFYREDTDQPDPLWRIKILNDSSIEVTGPPNESFSGKLVLNFTFQLSN